MLKKIPLILATLTLFLLISQGTALAEFRALLVGIDYNNADTNIRRLNGAVNDARDIYDLMTRQMGIPGSSIRMLTEKQATRSAILGAFWGTGALRVKVE